MLGNASLIAFIATTDASRTRAFYEDVLGLRFIADDGFALLFEANGTTLRIARVEALTPHPFTSLGWEVEDISTVMQTLATAGVAFEHYGLPGQDDTGAWTPPDTSTTVAWFKDPDGNLLSLTQLPVAGQPLAIEKEISRRREPVPDRTVEDRKTS